MKRYSCFVFAFVLVMLIMVTLPATVHGETYGGEFGENLTWSLSSDGTLTISGSGSMPDFGAHFDRAPWYDMQLQVRRVIVEPGVTSVGSRAFDMCLNLTSVSLPIGLESIGHWAFNYCLALEEVEIPEGVTTLVGETFSNCTALTRVTLPTTLRVIGKNCFVACEALKAVEISGSLTVIEQGAFSGCIALERVTISEGVEEIGYGAFENCASLQELLLPSTINAIGEAAFRGCWELTTMEIPSGVTVIAPHTFSNSGLKEVTIPASVTEIKYNAFADCRGLNEIVIPDSVKMLGGGCFENCYNLISAHLPENLTKITGGLFENCMRLEQVNIPSGVTTIYQEAFAGCEALQSVSIPLSVIEIGEKAFSSCKALEDVYYPGSDREWDDISVQSGNDDLLTATVHFGVAGHEHSHVPEVKPATCMMDGYTVYQCFCGDSYRTDPTGALGHEFVGDLCVRCGAQNVAAEFSDVKPEDYFSKSVTWAVEHGITAGTGNGAFSPNDPCTRGQVVTFLWRVTGKCVMHYPKTGFSDVQNTDYFYDAVRWASVRGVTSGTGDGFSPSAPCTRGQVVTFLWRLMGSEAQKDAKNPFTDVKAGDYYYDAVLWAVKNGITSGTSADLFSPNSICTRGQVVTFLGRTFQLDKLPKADKPYTVGSAWTHPAVYAEVEGMEHPVYDGKTRLNGVMEDINSFTQWGYDFLKFMHGGIAENDNQKGAVAQIVQDEDGRFGLEIFGWRHSYDETAKAFPILNVVFEAMHYFVGDWDIAYDLWRFVDDCNCTGYANTVDYGFTDVEQTELGWIIARDGVLIEMDTSVAGKTTFWFID